MVVGPVHRVGCGSGKGLNAIMEILLIGLNHGYQLKGCTTHDWGSFAGHLSTVSKTEQIDLIAEEMSEWAIQRHANIGATDSVARTVGANLRIQHLFCDPDPIERGALGILSEKELRHSLGFSNILNQDQMAILEDKVRDQWPIREAYWSKRLKQVSFKRCIFILGAKHVEPFEKQLTAEGFSVRIEDADWKSSRSESLDGC